MLKSLSFMIGGLLIKNLNHYQDMRNWYFTKIEYVVLAILLSITVLTLSAMPLTASYAIKTFISGLNLSTYLHYLLISLILTIYTLNSYNYGVKIGFYLLKKKYNFKLTTSASKITPAMYVYLIFAAYFCIIFILIFNYNLVLVNSSFEFITVYYLLMLFFINTLYIKLKLNSNYINLLLLWLFTILFTVI
jgi:hypothetical protein